jgi:uncharacterized protein (TIGR02687 family)
LEQNKKRDRFDARCESMICSLPSYTQLGMASLLPHKNLSIKDKNDTIYVDDISSAGLKNRDKILKSFDKNALAIGYEEFLKYKRDEGRKLFKDTSVVYIYHDEIDKTGEKNEIKTFEAVSNSFDTIIKIVKQIANFNGVNIFITSDHGFLYTNQPTLESEFCKVEVNDAIRVNRRFIIGKDLKEDICVKKFDGKTLSVDGDMEYLIAKSINKIRVQGGTNRFVHGGATLEELVIPLVEVHISKGKQDIKEVDVDILPLRTISTNTVNITMYQSQIVDEKTKPVTLKILFESLDGVVLSDEIKYTFDLKDEYATNREVRFKLTFRQNIKEYNNQNIKLVAKKIIEGSSQTPVYKSYEVKLSLAFFNDFDDDF